MSVWNYRVFVENIGTDCECWSIAEVFYNDQQKPTSWTDEIAPMGNDLEELREDLRRMTEALEKSPLYVCENEDGKRYLSETLPN